MKKLKLKWMAEEDANDEITEVYRKISDNLVKQMQKEIDEDIMRAIFSTLTPLPEGALPVYKKPQQ
jgi:hypothetical protein